MIFSSIIIQSAYVSPKLSDSEFNCNILTELQIMTINKMQQIKGLIVQKIVMHFVTYTWIILTLNYTNLIFDFRHAF